MTNEQAAKQQTPEEIAKAKAASMQPAQPDAAPAKAAKADLK